MGLEQKYITESEKEEVEETIEYYNTYKKNLVQFIIHSCSYSETKKTWGRVRLNPHEILEIQKEISRIEILDSDYDLFIL